MGKLSGIHNVELLLFQGGEEAFHPGVIIAAAGAAHALNELAAPEGLTEQLAGELASPVRVENSTLHAGISTGVFQCPHA